MKTFNFHHFYGSWIVIAESLDEAKKQMADKGLFSLYRESEFEIKELEPGNVYQI